MNSIGTITLDENLTVPDLYSGSGAKAGGELTTLSGRLIVQRLNGRGRLVSLTARADGNRLFGFYTRSQVEELRALANSGVAVAAVLNDQPCRVVVPLNGVQVEPLNPRRDQQAGQKYVGTVSVLIVG